MEIYQDNLTEKQKKNTKRPVNGKKPKQPFRFINDSYRNRSTPTWEKIVFILIGVIGLNVASYIVSFLRITTTFYDPDVGRTPFGQSLQRFLTYLIVLIGFLLLIFLDQHASYKKIFKDFASFKPYVYGLIGCLLLYIVNVIFNAIYSVTMPGIYGANNNQQSIESRRHASPALSIITVVLLAPFCEERTYRLGLLDATGKKNRWLGLIISAIIFGAIHFDWTPGILRNLAKMDGDRKLFEAYRVRMINEWLNLPIYISSGFILGLTYISSGKMASSWISHMLLNSISCIEVMTIASNRRTIPFIR